MPLSERWRSLERPTRFVLILAASFVVLRLLVATQSGFGFHQGWNEGHYALIARGFHDHPLVPEYGGHSVYNVPPLFPYLVAASFTVFGESVVAARLPSVLAAGVTIPAAYWLGREVYDDASVAAAGATLLAVMPYFQLYGGRAQTDAMMTATFTAAMASIVRGYRHGGRRWLVLGGGFFAAGVATKQPTLLLPAVVVAWLVAHRDRITRPLRKTAVLVGASVVALLPLFTWFLLNYMIVPDAFVADWERELFTRTAPFANVPLLIAVGFVLGMTPPVLFLAGVASPKDVWERRNGRTHFRAPNVLVLWLLVYGGFVVYRTPRGHQYYALPLAVPLALLAARGGALTIRWAAERGVSSSDTARLVVAAVLLAATAGGTTVLFELSGEFSVANGGGERVAPETGAAIAATADSRSSVLAPSEYRPPIQWYVRDVVPPERVHSYGIGELTADDLRSARKNALGAVYLVVVQPSPVPLPIDGTPTFSSDPYRFTTTPVVDRFVDVHGEFQLYVSDRGLAVYRLPPSTVSNTTDNPLSARPPGRVTG